MVWNSVALEANQLAAYQARKECFISTNRCRFRNADPHWSSNGRWDTPAIINDATTPARWVADGAASRYFRSSGASALLNAYLMFDLVELNSRLGQIDSMMIAGQFSHLLGTITADLQIANNADASDAINIGARVCTGVDGKVFRLLLGASVGYRSVRYIRIRFNTTNGAGFGGELRVSEVVLGTRRQLARSPRYPRATFRQAAKVSRFVSDSGENQDVVSHHGREPVTLGLRLGTGIRGFDDVLEVKELWRETEGGTIPFVFIDQPALDPVTNTYGNDAFAGGVFVRAEQDELAILQSGPQTFTSALELMEKPPFRELVGGL